MTSKIITGTFSSKSVNIEKLNIAEKLFDAGKLDDYDMTILYGNDTVMLDHFMKDILKLNNFYNMSRGVKKINKPTLLKHYRNDMGKDSYTFILSVAGKVVGLSEIRRRSTGSFVIELFHVISKYNDDSFPTLLWEAIVKLINAEHGDFKLDYTAPNTVNILT